MAKKTTTSTSKSASTEGAQAPFVIRIPVNPVPASRPRVTRWGTYYGKTYKNWMAEAAKALKVIPPRPMYGPLYVEAVFVVERAKTSKRLWPRGDVDNYLKAAFDAVTKAGICWHDDDQIVVTRAVKVYADLDDPGPHTTLTVYPE